MQAKIDIDKKMYSRIYHPLGRRAVQLANITIQSMNHNEINIISFVYKYI